MKFHLAFLLSLFFFLSTVKSSVNLKIVPSHQFILQKQDIDGLKNEIEHDINKEINKLEENWASKERMRERSSGVWNLHGAPIFLPKQYAPYAASQALKNNNNMASTEKESDGASDSLSGKLESQLETANTLVKSLESLTQEEDLKETANPESEMKIKFE